MKIPSQTTIVYSSIKIEQVMKIKNRNSYDKLVVFVTKYGLNAKKETELREIIKEILKENKIKIKDLLSDFIDNEDKYVLQLKDSNLFIAEDFLYTSDVTKAKVFDSKEAKWQINKQDEFTLGFLHWYNTSQDCETYLRRNYPKNITMNGEHYKKVLEINKELLEMYKNTLPR